MHWALAENKVVDLIPVLAGTTGTPDSGEKQVCMTTNSVLVNFLHIAADSASSVMKKIAFEGRYFGKQFT